MLQLSNLFSDHAILQREMPVPVWGWSAPGTVIKVTLSSGEAAAGVCADDGKFMVRLPAMKAGGPLEMTVKSDAGETILVQDLYIGEVWIAGGQSNMEMPLKGFQTPIPCLDALKFGAPVRMLTVPHCTTLTRRADVDAAWTLPDGEDLMNWSAAGAFFAARLSRELKVPIGILSSNWGGTIAEAWISREMLIRNPDARKTLLDYEEQVNSVSYWESVPQVSMQQTLDPDEQAIKIIQNFYPEYPANLGQERNWHEPAFHDSDWGVAKLPGTWQSLKLFPDSGALWFRKQVTLPAHWKNRPLVLEIGSADKHDVTYFNGVQVGATGKGVELCHWNVARSYPVPAQLVQEDCAVIAVRVYSFIYGGGLIGPADAMRLRLAEDQEGKETISLAGEWRWQLEQSLGNTSKFCKGIGFPNSPGILFDDMIVPLIPYAVRGAIWYQGEANADAPDAYRQLMRNLIEDWRFRWGQTNFDFYQVLLAGFADPLSATWPEIRDAQILAAQDTNSGFASATDIGDPVDIHPLDKYTVGERLALRALQDTYQCPLEGKGPEISEIQWGAKQVCIRFAHADGLYAGNGGPAGLEIAGEDEHFVLAQAEIDGNCVCVSADSVLEPCAVRYAWRGYPAEANLYNSNDLPMLPFFRKRQMEKNG